jgi:hypothetical protein
MVVTVLYSVRASLITVEQWWRVVPKCWVCAPGVLCGEGTSISSSDMIRPGPALPSHLQTNDISEPATGKQSHAART